jgi:hypothetical protein
MMQDIFTATCVKQTYREVNSHAEVKLIDFDWSGPYLTAMYPHNDLNVAIERVNRLSLFVQKVLSFLFKKETTTRQLRKHWRSMSVEGAQAALA